jgi:predicted nuclease with TOPRIM domain
MLTCFFTVICIDSIFVCCIQLETRKNVLDIELKNNLRKRRDALTAQLEAVSSDSEGLAQASQSIDSRLKPRKTELRTLEKRCSQLVKKIEGKNTIYIESLGT